jgi:S-methylmethionine-dependent homocysteine/selenocysteine methylase/SAM-dependent methyltransferase
MAGDVSNAAVAAETEAGLTPRESAYRRIAGLIASDRCVILDGGTATELREVADDRPELQERLWGTGALVRSPAEVLRVHRTYVDVGCDVISTDTWGLPTAVRDERPSLWEADRPVHWMDVARRGIALARRAAVEGGRGGECAIAFSVNGDVDTAEGGETIRLLARVFEEDPPDIVLLETLSLVRSSTYATVERLLATGIPVWLSFRRCLQGVCGVYGEHWGGPEGDAFGRAARRFEQMGIAALLINCIPPDHVGGMISWMRDFTDLPLGAYPNLGYLSTAGWRTEAGVGGAEYAEMALRWRAEGAQIIGGCCGVGPEHLAAARTALEGVAAGHTRPRELAAPVAGPGVAGGARIEPWTDERGSELFPLDFPDLLREPGVFAPTQGSFLVWKYLFGQGIGRDRRCLDVGCGTGLQTVQLAKNGATHVHAIDVDRRAVSNTLTNAFRNGVADRVSAAAVDLYPWVPEERYDVIVASLYQLPVDPFEQASTHRPLDYWGRNLIDHLIAILPEALAADGVAYVMQLSIIGQRRTAELLDQAGFASRVVDFAFFEFNELFSDKEEQIQRVEQLSDAYHLKLGDQNVIVAYLIEVTRDAESEGVTA